MLNVLYTVDTEVWPRTDDWRETGMVRELDCDIRGRTAKGDFGVGYQIDVLKSHGLRGVFLVEALFAGAVGVEPLRAIVSKVQDGGHEVQLHLHTEWLRRIEPPMLAGRTGSNLRDYNEDEQAALIGRGLENL